MRNDWKSKTNDTLDHQEYTILQSFCQTPYGIHSAGVGPNHAQDTETGVL